MFGIGMTELLVIFVVGLLVLGPRRLPELARTLGKSLAEFRRAATDLRREFLDVADEPRSQPPSPQPPAARPEPGSQEPEGSPGSSGG
jgi:TatA/E family protein of Tat protein translocase